MDADFHVERHTKEDCRKGMHLFKKTHEDAQGTREECLTCGKVETYQKFSDGRINNAKWAKDHKLDLLQPFTDGNFERIYGTKNLAK